MRFYRTAILAAAIAIAWTPAQAGYHHVVYPVVKVVTPKSSTPAAAHHGQKFLCFTPGGLVVCTVAVLIVADEIRRSVEGPACATNKMTRQSYFGVVRDEPKLWRKLCKRQRDPNAVIARG